jgi:hypothetical protein
MIRKMFSPAVIISGFTLYTGVEDVAATRWRHKYLSDCGLKGCNIMYHIGHRRIRGTCCVCLQVDFEVEGGRTFI